MGQLNNTVGMYNKIIDTKNDMYVSDYSKHMETKPILVTYFNQNQILSTADKGLQDVEQHVGKNSPIKYNKIKDLPLYSVPVTNLNLEFDDKGPMIDFSGDGVIPPGIIEPLPYDYFSIDYVGKKYLFKVDDVQMDTVRSNNYYKISFHFSKIDKGIEQNVSQHSTVIYDNIGSKATRSILLDDDYNEAEKLTSLLIDIKNYIVDKYWDDQLAYFIYDENVYDPWVNEYLRKEKVFKFDAYNDIFIDIPEVLNEREFTVDYETSFLYTILKEKDANILKNANRIYLNNVNKKEGTVFNIMRADCEMYEIRRFKANMDLEPKDFVIDSRRLEVGNYIEPEVLDNIINNTPYTENITSTQNILNEIMSTFNDCNQSTSEDLRNVYNGFKKDFSLNNTFLEYISIISLACIIKEKINNIVALNR